MALVDSNRNHVHEVVVEPWFLACAKMFSFLNCLNMQMLYYQQAAIRLRKKGTFTNTERAGVQRLLAILPDARRRETLVDRPEVCE